MKQIDLGGVTLAAFATSGWVCSDLTDWRGQAPSKTEHTQRPQQHGAFPVSRVFRSSRALSFKAVYRGGSESEMLDAVDTLSTVGAEGPVRVSVTESDGSVSWRLVTVETAQYTDHRGAVSGEIAVDMIAADPRRYADGAWQQTGPAVQSGGLVWPAKWPLVWPVSGSSGRVILPNPGRAPSPAVFRLLGPFDSALITCVESGARVGFNRPVPAGSVVDISGRHAVIDGQSDVSRWLQFREWTDVPGGESRTFQFDPVGGAAAFMQGKVDPAWW